ncbi:MAG: esterase-like activity of phytase family protein [Bauldia sp.]|nr:esterase-like activity of phytase family protein [Bauldia sp.]
MTLARLLLAAAPAALFATTASAQIANPAYVGDFTLPTGLLLDGAEFGGISGLDFDRATGLYYAISDDRAERGPARLYTLKLAIDDAGIHSLDIVSTVEIKGAAGAIPRLGLDGESIRFDAARGSLYWSSERDEANVPGLFAIAPDGAFQRAFEVPAYYVTTADGTAGVYGNLGFEGLALSEDGASLYAMTENALAQDGPKATLEAGSRARLIRFDIASGQPAAEYLYETDPIFTPATADPPFNDNGVSEILALDADTFLVMERSFAGGVGNEINLYVAELAGATDIIGAATAPADAVPMSKTLVLTIGEGDFGLDIDNVEAMTFGPEIGGKRTLVIASDNNFSATQITQFVAFTVE